MKSLIKHLSLGCMLLAACDEVPNRVEVTQTRTASVAPKPAVPGVTSAERFGGGVGATRKPEGDAPLAWDDPEGWSPVAPTEFRTANYSVASDTECYLTLLPGEAGGALANLNRWRDQMGLDPMSETDLAQTTRIRLLGQPAPFVVLEGEFTGMGGPSRSGWMMYGALLGTPAGTLFVKMVGPALEVRPERERFLAFCESLRIPGIDNEELAQHSDSVTSNNTESTTSGAGFEWTTPANWTQEPKRSMRVVSYRIGEGGEAECYVSVLGGGAGGVEANVNRWRDQVGLRPLTPKEVGELPQLDVLGGKATLFEASGAFTGMGGQEAVEGQSILGIIRELEGSVLFVKMVGPESIVAQERDSFVEFCTSLREG